MYICVCVFIYTYIYMFKHVKKYENEENINVEK